MDASLEEYAAVLCSLPHGPLIPLADTGNLL